MVMPAAARRAALPLMLAVLALSACAPTDDSSSAGGTATTGAPRTVAPTSSRCGRPAG